MVSAAVSVGPYACQCAIKNLNAVKAQWVGHAAKRSDQRTLYAAAVSARRGRKASQRSTERTFRRKTLQAHLLAQCNSKLFNCGVSPMESDTNARTEFGAP